MAEEKQLDLLTQRRVYAGIQRDPNAPEKPWRPPSSQRKTPSDTHLKRYSALSTEDELQQKRLSENMEEREEVRSITMVGHLFQNLRYTISFAQYLIEMREVRLRLVLVHLSCCILHSRLAFLLEIGVFRSI